jgi:protein SCO1/2
MKNTKGKSLLIILLVLPVLLFFMWRQAKTSFTPLPIMGETEMDGSFTPHTIRDFTLTDHTNTPINLATFNDQILIANFFYATCPDVCPAMNNNLRLVVEKFKNNPDVAFLSTTVNPDHDSIEVLAEYGGKYAYPDDKWRFATGSMREIYDLGTAYYRLAAARPDGAVDFIHSSVVVLVDKKHQIRGYYESNQNPKFATELINGIKTLLGEYYLEEGEAKGDK